jgi:hypothetical protein
MANTTKDLRVTLSLANMYAPQQDGKNIAARVYYIGQALVKDANGRLDNPGDSSLYVIGVFKGCQYDAAAQAALAADAEEYTAQTGEYFHFENAAAPNAVLATTKSGAALRMLDNKTVSLGASLEATIVYPGAGYTGAPTVVISAPDLAGGVQAVATATFGGGVITGIVFSNTGSGYSKPATITLVGGVGMTTPGQVVANLAGSPGLKFIGWDQGRLKVGIGPQYW